MKECLRGRPNDTCRTRSLNSTYLIGVQLRFCFNFFFGGYGDCCDSVIFLIEGLIIEGKPQKCTYILHSLWARKQIWLKSVFATESQHYFFTCLQVTRVQFFNIFVRLFFELVGELLGVLKYWKMCDKYSIQCMLAKPLLSFIQIDTPHPTVSRSLT